MAESNVARATLAGNYCSNWKRQRLQTVGRLQADKTMGQSANVSIVR